MQRKLFLSVGTLLLIFLTASNTRLAMVNWDTAAGDAHDWGNWHWDQSNFEVYLFGTHQNEAIRSINIWNSETDVRMTSTSSHGDMSVWGGNFGDTGWSGLASIEKTGWDWHCWANCRIAHGHARYNSYFGSGNSWFAQGVFCQEVGHLFGLGHNSRGGCMGLTYYDDHTNRPSAHDIADVNRKY
ncbi:MAG: hypothetical protein ACR2GQ_09210 [Gemmatimonadota bacterium]